MNSRRVAAMAIVLGITCTSACKGSVFKAIGKGLARDSEIVAFKVAERDAFKGVAGDVAGGAERAEAKAATTTGRELPSPEVEPAVHGNLEAARLGNSSADHDLFVLGATEERREEHARALVSDGDRAASGGDIERAADAYEQALALAPSISSNSADSLARTAIVDLVRNRTDGVADVVEAVVATQRQLSPEVRQGLLLALKPHLSPAASKHITRVLDVAHEGTDGLTLAWYENRLVTLRSVRVEQKADLEHWPPDPSLYSVFIDDRLRVGHEGLIPHLLEDASAWRKHPEVRIESLGSLGELAELPERLHEPTRNVYAMLLTRELPAAGGIGFLIALNDSAPRPGHATNGR